MTLYEQQLSLQNNEKCLEICESCGCTNIGAPLFFAKFIGRLGETPAKTVCEDCLQFNNDAGLKSDIISEIAEY